MLGLGKRKGGWVQRTTPDMRTKEKVNFHQPILVLRNNLDRTSVQRGSEKIMVRASPIGRYSRQAKVSPTLTPEEILWDTTKYQSMHRTGRKLVQPVTTRMRPRTAVCIPDLARSMSVTLRLKYWNRKLLTVKRMPLKAAKRRPMAPP